MFPYSDGVRGGGERESEGEKERGRGKDWDGHIDTDGRDGRTVKEE